MEDELRKVLTDFIKSAAKEDVIQEEQKDELINFIEWYLTNKLY